MNPDSIVLPVNRVAADPGNVQRRGRGYGRIGDLDAGCELGIRTRVRAENRRVGIAKQAHGASVEIDDSVTNPDRGRVAIVSRPPITADGDRARRSGRNGDVAESEGGGRSRSDRLRCGAGTGDVDSDVTGNGRDRRWELCVATGDQASHAFGRDGADRESEKLCVGVVRVTALSPDIERAARREHDRASLDRDARGVHAEHRGTRICEAVLQ